MTRGVPRCDLSKGNIGGWAKIAGQQPDLLTKHGQPGTQLRDIAVNERLSLREGPKVEDFGDFGPLKDPFDVGRGLRKEHRGGGPADRSLEAA